MYPTDLITKFFDNSFASRWSGNCGGWTWQFAMYHIVADLLIFIAYMAIPILLLKIVRERKDIPFGFFFIFSTFIVGCGLTHLTGALINVWPYYYIEFWAKAVTAVASLGTTWMLWQYYPQIVGLPNPFTSLAKIQETNLALKTQTTELLALENKLIAKNNELEQFACLASHDLKAPLRAIANLAQWVSEDLASNASKETQKHLSLMRDRVSRMDNLIEGILQYSRIGRVNVETKILDTDKIVRDIVDGLEKKQFVITIDTLPPICGNQVVVTQLFHNLIVNGILHHTRDDGKISVTVNDDGQFYRFEITDDGPGIPKDLHNKLFIMFSTLKPATVNSTGIGLALCKKIVTEVGGSIWVESDAGCGAKFIFTWPKYLNEGLQDPPH